MIKQTLLIILGVLVSSTSTPVFSNVNNSNIGVSITEPELYISNVSKPRFQSYHSSPYEQIIYPLNDLVIKVTDNRNLKEPWQIRYKLSLLRDSSGAIVNNQILYSLNQGELKIGDKLPSSLKKYQAKKINGTLGDGGIILTVSEKFSNYEYRVKNKELKIHIPADLKVGYYQTTQTITLESMPTYD